MMLIYEDMRGISSQYMKERKPLIGKRSRFIFTVHERKINFNYLKTQNLAVFSSIYYFFLKKKEGVSSRTISPPIADPPQVLVKIPIGK